MTPLRQRMTEDMQLRGLAPATQQAYLRYVEQLALFTGKSPDLATDEDFRQFFLALHKQRGLSRSTATVAIAAFKFLFEITLQRPWPRLDLFRPRPTQTLPVILSVDEVWRILDHVEQPTYYTCASCQFTCYSYHSCRNRHCSTCQQDTTQAWLAAQQALLLPVPYFLVTFKLPSELRSIARQQPETIYPLLFRTSARALQQLAQDPRFLGGQIGMLGVLQTWTRDLRYHP